MVAGCKEKAASRAERAGDPVTVTLASSRVGPVQRQVEVVGTLHGDEEATVSAKVPGRIVQIARDVGDRAPAGEPLAQIERTDYDLAVAQKQMAVQASLAKLGLVDLPPVDFDLAKVPTVERARLQSANVQAKFERGRKLHEQKPPLISDQDFADLQTAFEVARSNHDVELLTARALLADARARQSELNQETQRLSDTTVRAPQGRATESATRPAATQASKSITYAVANRLVSVGEYVREGTSLFRLVADDPIKFRAQVPERFLGQVKVGQAVRVFVQAYPDAFDGIVARISPQVETATRTFQVETLVPNSDGKLQPGSFARGAILTRVDPQVTLVPADAVVTFAGVSKVFTLDNERKAVEKKVELGQAVGDALEVTRGLEGVMPVVIEGRNKLATGIPVVASAAATSQTVTRAQDAPR
ncbi:MAG: efflux RND transporter periplasmic adaptor subunit [Tepidisphaeraceae bacterium]